MKVFAASMNQRIDRISAETLSILKSTRPIFASGGAVAIIEDFPMLLTNTVLPLPSITIFFGIPELREVPTLVPMETKAAAIADIAFSSTPLCRAEASSSPRSLTRADDC